MALPAVAIPLLAKGAAGLKGAAALKKGAAVLKGLQGKGILKAGIQVLGAVSSFKQASKQRELQEEAERAAEEQAKRIDALLSQRFAQMIPVATEATMLQLGELQRGVQRAGDVAQEVGGARGMFALGNVQREAMEGARRITADLQKQEVDRAKAIAKEEMLMGIQQADIAAQRAEGAQKAAAQAEERAAQARKKGFAGLQSALGSISLDPFSKSERNEAIANLAGLGGTGFNMGGMDLTGSEQIGGMDMSAPQGLSDFSQYSFGGLGGAPKLGSSFIID